MARWTANDHPDAPEVDKDRHSRPWPEASPARQRADLVDAHREEVADEQLERDGEPPPGPRAHLAERDGDRDYARRREEVENEERKRRKRRERAHRREERLDADF